MKPRPKGPEAKARGYEAEAKILASRPVWPRGLALTSLDIATLGKVDFFAIMMPRG